MKIRTARVELFHADRQIAGQTDMTKLILAFRNFAQALKTCLPFVLLYLFLCSVHLHGNVENITYSYNTKLPIK
jgi:hypothetical protein